LAIARLTAQRGVQGGQCTRPPKAPRDLDGSPRRRGGSPPVDHHQRRSVAAVNLQPIRIAQQMPGRREDVKVVAALGIEAVCRRRGTEADGDRRARAQVEATQSGRQVGLAIGVNAGPHLDQFAAVDASVELTSAQHPQQVSRGRYPTVCVEHISHRIIHASDVRAAEASATEPYRNLWTGQRMWITRPSASARKVGLLHGVSPANTRAHRRRARRP
jgi:hypothetical protein